MFLGVCASQSVSRKVEFSLKLPSSKTSRNSQPSSPIPWIECGTPVGKNQRSPSPDVVQERLAPPVDGGDPRAALEDVGPLGLLVEVELADGARLQPHVDAGDLRGDGRTRGSWSAAPSRPRRGACGCRRTTTAGSGAVPASVARRHEHVRVLGLARRVPRAEDVRAVAVRMGSGAVRSGAPSCNEIVRHAFLLSQREEPRSAVPPRSQRDVSSVPIT